MPWKLTPATCTQCGTPFMSNRYRDGSRQKFCSQACHGASWKGTATSRFWRMVDKREPDDCWPWLGAIRSQSGHGGFKDEERWTHAHRFSYRLAFGEIPPGGEVCHRCDNPPCVNPAHLFLGTHQTNMADSAAKGRSRNGSKPGLSVRGKRHGNAKVTEAIVIEIRRRYAAGGILHRELAAEYGIHKGTVSDITRRLIWQHVD